MDNRLNNILNFTIIFLSGDIDLLYQSPDYILEKIHLYFGDIIIKKHDECRLFNKYKKIWKNDDYRINSVFLFLLNVINYKDDSRLDIDPYGEEDWYDIVDDIKNIAIHPDEYFNLFNKWIGNVKDIPDIKRKGIHHVLKMKMYDVYKDTFLN